MFQYLNHLDPISETQNSTVAQPGSITPTMSSNDYQHTLLETEKKDEHTDNYMIRWTIPKFRLLMQSKAMTRQYRTHKNSMIKTTNSKFHLKLCFHGRKNELCDIYYMTTSSIFLKYTLQFNVIYTSIETVDYHSVKAYKWQHCKTCDTKKLYEQCERREDTRLQIEFNFQVSRETKDDYNIIPTPQLSNDFENLLNDGNNSDVTIKSSEGVEFKVHKNIICIRSKVLKAHFEHNTSESITNLVETTWETEVLREVLTFVYTDKCPRIEEFPEKLLAAADYYQLEGLKRICEVELSKRLTAENAIDTLQLAELHSADILTESTLDFIKCGRTSLVIETEGWKNIQSVEFIKKIYEYIMSNEIDNSDILASALKEISPDLNK